MKHRLSNLLAILLTVLLLSIGASAQSETDAKQEGVVRVGLAGVKTGAVGDGINAAELAQAVGGALPEYFKGTRVETIALEARLPSAIEAEAVEKGCDYVLFATVSHKKGGGMFGKALGKLSETVSRQAYGSSNVVGKTTQVSIMTVAAVSRNVEAKDEIALEIKLTKAGAPALTKQFKAKAKADGESILAQVVEQAAEAIVEAAK